MVHKELSNLKVRNVKFAIGTLAEYDTIKTLIEDFGLDYSQIKRDKKPVFVTTCGMNTCSIRWRYRIWNTPTGDFYEASRDTRLLNTTAIATKIIDLENGSVDVEYISIIPQCDFLTLLSTNR
jgi:hypothetical protein